ncbi:unnamed protein product [Lactuca saligna]|uniref:Uncharacterized protein n=1 Tax=Lactuca saligna TaxID=75948 RepID=A0AA35Y835_LACSI|nr:unnamed protein product [Lactuca saligna]
MQRLCILINTKLEITSKRTSGYTSTCTYSFQNEVCRMRLDITMLDELIHEYCLYRGIVNSGAPNPSCEAMKIGHEQSESESTLSVEARSGSNKLVDADMDSPGTEERYPCGTMSNNHEDSSTSGNK